jgi:homogentisate 1,2-dioxygenase
VTPHGPDVNTFEKASNAELKPVKIATTDLAFMFETSFTLTPTVWATNDSNKLYEGGQVLQKDYYECWQKPVKNFKA